LKVIALPARDSASSVQGVLSFVDNEVDTSTGTVLLKGRFPNHDGTLWPGEYVNITLVLGTQTDAIVVPSQAVMQGQQGTYVFVVNNDGTATSQPITVQRTLYSLSVIAGVPAGPLAVTDGQLRLTPTAKVDGRGRRHPARETVLDQRRHRRDDVVEHHGRHQYHAPVRAFTKHRRGGAGRAGRHLQNAAPAAARHSATLL